MFRFCKAVSQVIFITTNELNLDGNIYFFFSFSTNKIREKFLEDSKYEESLKRFILCTNRGIVTRRIPICMYDTILPRFKISFLLFSSVLGNKNEIGTQTIMFRKKAFYLHLFLFRSAPMLILKIAIKSHKRKIDRSHTLITFCRGMFHNNKYSFVSPI